MSFLKFLHVILDFLIDVFLFSIVFIKSLSRFLAQPSLFDHFSHERYISATHAHTQIGVGQKACHVTRHVDANFVRQSNGTNGHSEFLHGVIQFFQWHAILYQGSDLHQKGSQTTIDVKAWHILDNDTCLALFRRANFKGRGLGLVTGALVWDNLKKGHLRNGRKVVHADNVFWTFGTHGNVLDGNGGCIGSKDTVIGSDLLHLFDNLTLESQILKDGFDDHISTRKMLGPRRIVVREWCHVGSIHVVLILGHALLF
mmetsp:Transcript_4040/g.6071  ORF Transcript_4040/g.6071 Transcript_4040/m.6071 type:complete len:257 (-) Transcript_4040:2062-2832(-)